MSNHFTGLSLGPPLGDQRLDLCDLYAFQSPTDPSRTVIILNANPNADALHPDAMLFQRLSPSAEQKMIDEVADSLRGLSQDEIKTILDHLDRAVQAPDPTIAGREQREAYQKHRAVVAQRMRTASLAEAP